jgi:CitMHS family citrate-Mg2+:H+ or citrate-Ca2+:H+ symporter
MWKALLPMQAAGLAFCVAVAFFIEFVVYKGKGVAVSPAEPGSQIDFSERPLARPKLFTINFLIFIGCIVTLLFVQLPTYLIFMLFFDATLLINYPSSKIQKQLINKYCPTMLNPCLIFLAIGVMVGVMKESGMVKGMIDALLTLIPASAAKYTHVILGVFSVPIMMMIPYQLFYSIFPILIGIAANFGISSMAAVMSFTLLYGSQCSPMTAAANLCAELGETEITVHCRNLFFPVWIACVVTIVVGVVSGGLFM